jgi:VCBS repeat-containing protein
MDTNGATGGVGNFNWIRITSAGIFDFSLTNSGNVIVNAGTSAPDTITANLVSGTSQAVTFSTSGLPSGATASYSQASCSPTCSNILTLATSSSIASGTYPITITGTAGGLSRTTTFNLIITSSSMSSSSPFYGTAFVIPTTIQAEDFDNGGEGVAYHDVDAVNLGGAYRSTGVDIEPTSDTGGGFDVGWTRAGEWLKYSINVPTAGNYNFDVRVASAGSGGTFHIEVDGVDQTGALVVPNTGGWQVWQTITKSNVSLSVGPHVLRLVMDTNGPTTGVGNFNWIRISTN